MSTYSKVLSTNTMIKVCDVENKEELINHSLTLFSWCLSEIKKGNTIASVNMGRKEVQEVKIPSLETAKMYYHSKKENIVE